MASLPMSLEPVDVREMRRKVLDHPQLVGRYKRLAIVRVGKIPYRFVVNLSDRLVVERCTIPQCKLALVVAREEPPGVRRPLDDPAWGSLLIDRRVYEVVADGSGRVEAVSGRRQELVAVNDMSFVEEWAVHSHQSDPKGWDVSAASSQEVLSAWISVTISLASTNEDKASPDAT